MQITYRTIEERKEMVMKFVGNLCVVFLVFLLILIGLSEGQLKVGFYSQRCPNAEAIVKSVVKEATAVDPRMPPILLRLHFHDCFVEGCDGSVLIEKGENSEKRAGGHQGLGGFDQIKKAKQALEAQCPGVVSCADIVAIAARDAVDLAGGPKYEVETGRRDGRVSDIKLAADFPDVNDSIETLKSKFSNKGLSSQELVILSAGAHSIGTVACFFMTNRLYNFSGTNKPDPDITIPHLQELQRWCPKNGDQNVRVSMDMMTRDKFDDQIMRNIKYKFATLASDARLNDDAFTKQVVDFYAEGTPFKPDFAKAMITMGRIGVKVGSNGEIRQKCDAFN